MTILLIDDAVALANMFADAIQQHTGRDVVVVTSLAEVAATLTLIAQPAIALVDLSFPQQDGSGIDALVEVIDHSPTTKLVIITQGDEWVADLLRDACELLPIATVISKSAPLKVQLSAITDVLRHGTAQIDPAIRPLLPLAATRLRARDDFRRLVPHAGHAKLWLALRTCDPSYRAIAAATNLKLNTLKNYRAQLLPELRLHGLVDPGLPQMQAFSRRCWPFLRPWVEEARPL